MAAVVVQLSNYLRRSPAGGDRPPIGISHLEVMNGHMLNATIFGVNLKIPASYNCHLKHEFVMPSGKLSVQNDVFNDGQQHDRAGFGLEG
jgi:hypothetical protein